jgi:hypothetical protein
MKVLDTVELDDRTNWGKWTAEENTEEIGKVGWAFICKNGGMVDSNTIL